MSNTDNYLWIAAWGGAWSAAANWTDTTVGSGGAPAGSPPGASNAVTINGSTINLNSSYQNGFTTTYPTTVTGTGAAAQLTIGSAVLFLGTVAVGGAVTLSQGADFELDGGAKLTAGSLTISASAFGSSDTFRVGSGSNFTTAGTAVLSNSSLVAIDGGTVRLGGLLGSGAYYGNITVDGSSSVEIGTAGGAAAGAVTIDKGKSVTLSVEISGNVVVNGTINVQAGGHLGIDDQNILNPAQSISGLGTLILSEGSTLSLGAADSAAIQFAGPFGTLILNNVLAAGTISGFVAGDVIRLNGLATGLSYAIGATSTKLTLRQNGKLAGTLTLAGNYTGSVFHLSSDGNYFAAITVQTIGKPPVQPGLITGTVGADNLYATANNQILTGLGGGDTLDGGSFTGINFRDTTADLNGSTIQNFSTADLLDFTDLNPATAKLLSYTGGVLSVTDGTHAATLGVSFTTRPASGHFSLAADSTGKGTNLTWHS